MGKRFTSGQGDVLVDLHVDRIHRALNRWCEIADESEATHQLDSEIVARDIAARAARLDELLGDPHRQTDEA